MKDGLNLYTGVNFPHAWGWSVSAHCFGPFLRSLNRDVRRLGPNQLTHIAQHSVSLSGFSLSGDCHESYEDIARFIGCLGSTLTRLELGCVASPVDRTQSVSVIFQSLALHGTCIESFEIAPDAGVRCGDIRVLAQPGCLPRLRQLTIAYIDVTPAEDESTSKERCCEEMEEAVTAVLDTHQTSLELISFGGDECGVGGTLAQARLGLHRANSLGQQ
jgi:hypothetical protein